MGPSLQLVGARFLNFLLRKLSRDFKLSGMSILQDFQRAIFPLLLEARVTLLGLLVVLFMYCAGRYDFGPIQTQGQGHVEMTAAPLRGLLLGDRL